MTGTCWRSLAPSRRPAPLLSCSGVLSHATLAPLLLYLLFDRSSSSSRRSCAPLRTTHISARSADTAPPLASPHLFCLPGTSCPFPAVGNNDCQAPEKQKQPQTRGELFQERCCGSRSAHRRQLFLRPPGFLPGSCGRRCRRTVVLFPAAPNFKPINGQCGWHAGEHNEAPGCPRRIPTVRHEGMEFYKVTPPPPSWHMLCIIMGG